MKLNASSNSEAIWCVFNFQQPFISKMAGLSAKHTPKSVCYPVLYGHCHLDKQIVKAPGLLVSTIVNCIPPYKDQVCMGESYLCLIILE